MYPAPVAVSKRLFIRIRWCSAGLVADPVAVTGREAPAKRAAGAVRMAQPTYEQLLDVIPQKHRQIAQLEARTRRLEARNRRLEAQVVQLQARVAQLMDKTTRPCA